MGKLSYLYTDSDEADDTSSSVESVKKKKRLSSILKYGNGNVKKKKCKVHSKSEPDEFDYRSSHSSQRISMQKLRGILKHREPESSEEDEDSEPTHVFRSQDRCFVGRVPRPAGAKPGRGGGVAIIVRKHGSTIPMKPSTTSTKKRSTKRLSRKRSY